MKEKNKKEDVCGDARKVEGTSAKGATVMTKSTPSSAVGVLLSYWILTFAPK